MAISMAQKGSKMRFSQEVEETVNPIVEEVIETSTSQESDLLPEEIPENSQKIEATLLAEVIPENVVREADAPTEEREPIEENKRKVDSQAIKKTKKSSSSTLESELFPFLNDDEEEKEIYSVRKQIVLKPSTAAKLEKILKKKGWSFNKFVNKYLEYYVDNN